MHNYSCVMNFAKSTCNKLFFAQLIWAQLSCDHNFGLMTKAGAGQGKRVEKEAELSQDSNTLSQIFKISTAHTHLKFQNILL